MRPVRQIINQDADNPATGAPVVLDQYLTPFNVTLACVIIGAPTYTVEWTLDDAFSPTFDPSTATWFPAESNLVAADSSQVGSLVSPVSAVRCRVTAGTLGTDGVEFTAQQAGIQLKYLAWLLAFLLFCGQAVAQNGGGPNGGGGGGGGGTPGGSDGQIQYNASGSFGGIGGSSWNGTVITSPYLSGAGLYSTSQLTSANHVTTAYAAQAGVAYLTGLQATNQSFTSFIGRNTTAGGFTTMALANDSYALGSLLTVPNSAHCCDVNADHQLNIYLGGTTAPSGFINGLLGGEEAAIATTGHDQGLCLGVFAHCIFYLSKTYGTAYLADTSGATVPALTVSGAGTTSNTDYVMAILGPNASGGVSNGLNIQAGADAGDLSLNVQAATAGLSLSNIRWDGVIKTGVPQALRLAGLAAADIRAGTAGGIGATFTGFASDPVGASIGWNLSGPIACVRINPFTATSNASNMTLTLPAALPGHGEGTVLVIDNGTDKFGTWYSDGTHIYFAVGPVPADATGNFTATGTKGLPGSVGPTLCWGAN